MGDYFKTEWAAMTLNDWVGLIVTVATLGLMIWAYIYALSPKNKEKLESQRHIPLDDDNDAEDTKQ